MSRGITGLESGVFFGGQPGESGTALSVGILQSHLGDVGSRACIGFAACLVRTGFFLFRQA